MINEIFNQLGISLLGWLKQEKSVFSQSRSLKSMLWQGPFLLRAVREGSIPGLSLTDVQMAIFSPCLFPLSSLHADLRVQISPFYKDTIHIGLGLYLILT